VGDSESMARNEETFGQIMISSRDPCNLNELFDDKNLMKKKPLVSNHTNKQVDLNDVKPDEIDAAKSKISNY
jgi:hypothetical protein